MSLEAGTDKVPAFFAHYSGEGGEIMEIKMLVWVAVLLVGSFSLASGHYLVHYTFGIRNYAFKVMLTLLIGSGIFAAASFAILFIIWPPLV